MTAGLTGRRIVVTGAASGIGAALANRLATDGAEVIGIDLHPAPGGLRCDLADRASIEDVAARIDAPVDGLAHVAGVPGTAPTATILSVNLLAVRRLTSLLLDRMAPAASVVAVSSITAHRCDWSEQQLDSLLAADDEEILRQTYGIAGPDAYAISKRLLNVWSAALAAHLLPRGIRANVVSPGPVQTPILRDFEMSMGAERLKAASDMVGRHGHPAEIAASIAFLLSPEASWVNGINLDCDGGFNNARRMAGRTAFVAAARSGDEPCS